MKKNNEEIWERVEAQLEALNRKLDILIKQSSQKPMERSSAPSRDRGFDSDRGGFEDRSGRMQYKAICAECGKSCGVPFKPSGGRPVFCSECFSKQQEEGGEEPRFHKKHKTFRKPAGGKKPFFKKR